MPRRGGFGGGGRSSKTSSSPSSSQKSRSYSSSSKPTTQPTRNTPTTTPMAPSGGGFMSNIASTALGVGGGMLLANAIGGLFRGSGDNQEALMNDNGEQQVQMPCQIQFESFGNCLSGNKTNIGNCQFAYDTLLSCNQNKQF
eukprot:TRINITY_DN21_c0_g1_i1.p1 TRINITY_DN21_c0_g1~~TRINITY_DN21_c0_g1_i1.p1  ORF type:complete len:142 (-),score=49.21 TRINITY_DN21_c0_g1_i1:43-468(-)